LPKDIFILNEKDTSATAPHIMRGLIIVMATMDKNKDQL
jgi:hypothetical protein